VGWVRLVWYERHFEVTGGCCILLESWMDVSYPLAGVTVVTTISRSGSATVLRWDIHDKRSVCSKLMVVGRADSGDGGW
jgi:hypothetical protein